MHAGPYGLVTDEDGWTVTAFHDSTYTSYTPAVNQQTLEYAGHKVLFDAAAGRATSATSKPVNGVHDH